MMVKVGVEMDAKTMKREGKNRRKWSAKSWLYFIVPFLAVSIFLLSMFLFSKDYEKLYVDEAEAVLRRYGIEDFSVSMESGRDYDGQRVHTLKVSSREIEGLGHVQIFRLCRDIGNIDIGNDNYFVIPKVMCGEDEYSLSDDSSLCRNHELIYKIGQPSHSVRHYCGVCGALASHSIEETREYYCDTHWKEMEDIVRMMLES